MSAVADSGFIVAVANKGDQWHQQCVPIYKQQRVIYIPQTTLAEVGYLLTKAGGNSLTVQFLSNLTRTKYQIVPLETLDIQRTAELLQQYVNSRVDFVDCTVATVAERLNICRILTIDRRDFDILRPKHCTYFEILP